MVSTAVLGFVLLVAVYSVAPSEAKLSNDQQEEILKAHNFYRSKVSPIATNMAALQWDTELAALAQFWSVNCLIEPNEKRHDQSSEYDYIGEIQAGSGNYSINLTSMVFEWFFEGRNYQYSTAACIDDDGNEEEEGCENYIQLTWASTRTVGCGAFRCEEIEGLEEEVEEGQTALMVVCYYGPGGGASGEQPYQTGSQACSACPSDLPDCDKKLCYDSGAPHTVAQVSIAMLLMFMGALSSLI